MTNVAAKTTKYIFKILINYEIELVSGISSILAIGILTPAKVCYVILFVST